jgi:hypothetical protein
MVISTVFVADAWAVGWTLPYEENLLHETILSSGSERWRSITSLFWFASVTIFYVVIVIIAIYF